MDLKLQPIQLGLCSTVQTLAIGIGSPLWGYVADRHPRKNILAVGCLSWGIFTIALASVSEFWIILILRFLNGLALSSVSPVTQSLILDFTPEDRRGAAFGWIQASQCVGRLFSAMITTSTGTLEVMPGIRGWRVAFATVGILSVLLGLTVLHVIKNEAPKPNSAHSLTAEAAVKYAEMKRLKRRQSASEMPLEARQREFGSVQKNKNNPYASAPPPRSSHTPLPLTEAAAKGKGLCDVSNDSGGTGGTGAEPDRHRHTLAAAAGGDRDNRNNRGLGMSGGWTVGMPTSPEGENAPPPEDDSFWKPLQLPSVWFIFIESLMTSALMGALAFMTMYFQYTGMEDWKAASIIGISLAAAIVGAPVGGRIGDALDKQRPITGRIVFGLAGRLTQTLFVFVNFCLLERKAENYPIFLVTSLFGGFVFVWTPCAVDRPLLSLLVQPSKRVSFFALLQLVEVAGAALLGAPMVAVLAEWVFGYDSEGSRDKAISALDPQVREKNAEALAKGLILVLLVPNVIAVLMNFSLLFTMHNDVAKAVGAQPEAAGTSGETEGELGEGATDLEMEDEERDLESPSQGRATD
uniref:Major facilitator superfamily (MFS) profile domain-containing protein n=1 Tax=Chromera velia CCMP2878 TaxID=1169474 RepID=A0A0G4I5E1_9ALVE|eukprot:Cvel_11124.t1-p1 / transcript=Cvel_11124.t1 / gene=Cvel_11124 / organism=Chromera_velia_CCMP2878 / gene_product=Multidrug resistance protein MdtG, putative / transcript_product=Multidrug resistance protein MdtG, putative / location=Cvel_scaffold689:20762-24083(-) / protein_length=578 / sequence_SO=supercontig / SO=protein_coding / is_pseudo=false